MDARTNASSVLEGGLRNIIVTKATLPRTVLGQQPDAQTLRTRYSSSLAYVLHYEHGLSTAPPRQTASLSCPSTLKLASSSVQTPTGSVESAPGEVVPEGCCQKEGAVGSRRLTIFCTYSFILSKFCGGPCTIGLV